MSVHLIECAAEVQLPPALKLALLCFADSGSQDGRIAKPGLDNLMRWTGLKRSRALEVVKHLQELQLLAGHRPAYRGQRAEYVVFPNGCCERHGKSSATVLSAVDEPEIADVAPLTRPSIKGSGTADPFFSTASGTSDPVRTNGSDTGPGKGPAAGEKGSDSDPGMGPGVALKTGALQEQPPTTDLQEQAPNSHRPQQPLPSREPQVVSMDFTRVYEPASDVRVVTPSGTPLGCRRCDAGYLTDSDGLPIAKCQHCHPAFRQRGASA